MLRLPLSICMFAWTCCLLACSGEVCSAPPSAGVHGLYDLAEGGIFPFPSDRFTLADPGSPTGLRLDLALPLTPLLRGAPELLGGDAQALLAQLNALDGFALRGPLLLPFDGALDPESLPRDAAASLAEASAVFLLRLDTVERVPIEVELLDWEQGRQILVARPVRGLAPAVRYALVATRRLRAVDGGEVGPSEDLWAACSSCTPASAWSADPVRAARRAEFELLSARLPELGEDLVSASLFTTQEQDSLLAGLWAAVQAVGELELDLDLDEDGQVDLYPPVALPGAPEGAEGLEHVHGILKGAFHMVEYRDEAGHMTFGSDGLPLEQGRVWVPFILALPAPEHQPAPVVIMQPGLHARKEDALYVAGFLAAGGLACLAIDLVEHGEGPSRDSAFIDLVDPGVSSANFLQSVADLAGLLRVLSESLSELDVVELGGADLDCGRVAFVGSSAGAMVGSLLLSRRPALDAAVLTVGGGGFHLFLDFYFDGILDAVELTAFGMLAQALMDKADPANHARALSSSQRPELPVLAQQVVGDAVMPAEATVALVRELELPLLEPVLLNIEGLARLEMPAVGRGLVQFDPASHGFLLRESNYPDSSRRAREQIVNFLVSTWRAADGQGIIDEP